VVFSLPANYNMARHFLPGVDASKVFELTRLWAPDGHERNLLTQAIAAAVAILRQVEPNIDLVVSYADPSAGHRGHVYRAASWIETGRSEEVRAWRHKDGGPILPRRAFHSDDRHLNKPEVEALGYVQLRLPGKHRFVRPLSRRAKRLWPAPEPNRLAKLLRALNVQRARRRAEARVGRLCVCGKPLAAQRSTARFCSAACRSRAWRAAPSS
jgi:hypothetical protein